MISSVIQELGEVIRKLLEKDRTTVAIKVMKCLKHKSNVVEGLRTGTLLIEIIVGTRPIAASKTEKIIATVVNVDRLRKVKIQQL